MHCVYFALSIIVAVGLHLLMGRAASLRARPHRRFVAEVLGVTTLTLLLAGFLLFVLRKETAAAFMAVSFGFYAGSFGLPAIWLWRVVRGPDRSKVAGVGAFILLGLGLYGLLIEPNRLTIRQESLSFSQWDEGGDPVRLVHISDLQSVGFCEREAEAVRMINALDADLILFTGDYIAGPFNDIAPAVQAARRFLSGLRSRHGVFAVAGHSENDVIRQEIFKGIPNVHYLRDEARSISFGQGRTLRIYGLDLDETWHAQLKVEDVADESTPGTVNVFVSHVPDISLALDGHGIDLHVAGHTHGGQIVIPGIGPLVTLSKLPRQHSRGLFRYGDHRLNVCAGIGMEGNHAPRIRLFCPPEICLLLLSGGS